MKQLFGINKKVLEGDKDENGMFSFTFENLLDSLVPIESEKKEERCTKCNGEVGFDKMFCSNCDGTGKEPRKEETYKETSAYLASKAISEVVKLEAKLSRYRTALEKIAELPGKGSSYVSIVRRISGTALAED